MASLNFSKDLHQSTQHAVLSEYVSGKGKDTQDTLDSFCKPVEESHSKHGSSEAVEQHLAKSWQSILDLASSSPFSEQRAKALADFLFQIQTRPDLQDMGKPYTVHDDKVWSELPLFGWQVREAWNAAPQDDKDGELASRWVNVNAFAAITTAAAHAHERGHPDLSLFALWTIRSALEDTQTPSNAALSAAAVWFVHAHESLHELSKQDKSFEGKLAKPGALAGESAWTGYSTERWNYWKQALAAAHGKSSDAATAQLVDRARAAVE